MPAFLSNFPQSASEPNFVDLFWAEMQKQAQCCDDALIQDLFAVNICDHADFSSALASLLGTKLTDRTMAEPALTRLVASSLASDPNITRAAASDIVATFQRDPACIDLATPFLFFKGIHALQAYRIAHYLWRANRRPLAYHLQSRINERFGIDIHPAAQIGQRITIDHGTGIVIGETTIIEDDVSLFQDVTLGGTGKKAGQRHPVIRQGCLIGAGAKILGHFEIGEQARIGAGAVVLEHVPPRSTAVGNPARIVRLGKMDQDFENYQI